jgi:ATP-dependent Clp protease protease subunit
MTSKPDRRLGFAGSSGQEWSPPGEPRPDPDLTEAGSDPRPDVGYWEMRVRETMLAKRIVTLRGTLDEGLAGQVALELMSLDASGDERITLYVDSASGNLEGAFTVMDVIDLLGVPVDATCLGRAEGPAVGVMAVSDHRSAAPHARFRLCEPQSSAQGRASDMQRFAEQQRLQLDRFIARIAEATGRPAEHVEADINAGRYLHAGEALEYGLIDDIWTPVRRAGTEGDGREPLGFRPSRRPHLSAYRDDPPRTQS